MHVCEGRPAGSVRAAVSSGVRMDGMSSRSVKVSIAGAAGRMGQRLCALAAEMGGLELVEAFERGGHESVGRPANSDGGLPIADHFAAKGDVLIDFTSPDGTRDLLDICIRQRKAMVIGTTGLDGEDHEAIDAAAKFIPIVQAPNMSLGVNLLFNLAAQVARQLGDDYDIEILEAHHRYKKDAPSGTALGIADAICRATGKDVGTDLVYTRYGAEQPREGGKITLQTLRIGDVVGEHTVFFGGLGERVELRHVASSRDTFARGALKAAAWLAARPPGRYTMKNVLGL